VFWGNQNLADPQSLNSYSYGNNNPINKKDPNGDFAISGIWSSIVNTVKSMFSRPSENGTVVNNNNKPSSYSPVTGSVSGIVVKNVIPNSSFVSQWNLPNPSTACRNACDFMGASTGKNINTVTYDNGKPVIQPEAKKGLNVIKDTLLAGKPVTVGVHMDTLGDVGNINNPATNHFIKVVGADVDQKGQYFYFFDPGTRDQNKGTSPQNRLYVNDDYSISGTSAYHDKINYVVTEIP
jgi:hypothetical protein